MAGGELQPRPRRPRHWTTSSARWRGPSAPQLPFLRAATAASFELFNPSIDESHFVVRNSSTKALYGFCATYYTKGVGIIGAIFVDPTKRNLSIGRSLHRRALRNLTQARGIKKIQLGASFPGRLPGRAGRGHDQREGLAR